MDVNIPMDPSWDIRYHLKRPANIWANSLALYWCSDLWSVYPGMLGPYPSLQSWPHMASHDHWRSALTFTFHKTPSHHFVLVFLYLSILWKKITQLIKSPKVLRQMEDLDDMHGALYCERSIPMHPWSSTARRWKMAVGRPSCPIEVW